MSQEPNKPKQKPEANPLLEHSHKELPSKQKQTEDEKLDIGKQARDFLESPEHVYFTGLIQRRVNSLQVELLELPRKDTERFQEIKTRISELDNIAGLVRDDKMLMERILARKE